MAFHFSIEPVIGYNQGIIHLSCVFAKENFNLLIVCHQLLFQFNKLDLQGDLLSRRGFLLGARLPWSHPLFRSDGGPSALYSLG